MFRRRLAWFWILLTAVALILVGRLFDIQVLRAEEYEDLATRLLTRPVRYLRAPRGSIIDRHGRILVSDEPASDIDMHYAVLTGRSRTYLRAWARRLRRLGEFPASMSTDDVAAQLRLEIVEMWQRLAELTGRPVSEFIARGEHVRHRVQRIRAAVRRRTGVEQRVLEEFERHPVVENVGNEVALAVRLELEHRPWLRVVPGSRRVAHDADAVVHLLGRLGAVSPQHLEEDPLRGDELRKLRPADRCGLTGVEQLAEPILRGTRGYVVEELDRTVTERADPLPGGDVVLTIDMELQKYVLGLVERAVESRVSPAGGSAVVIDVATREVRALVSYPVYSYERFNEQYGRLIRDAKRLPMRFRAVSGLYPPGSTCKAITLVGALADAKTSEHEHVHCTGHLLADKPNQFRCWIYNRFRTTHDARQPEGQQAEDAIRNSCNIYFYKMGGRLGPQRLCEWFSRFGLGRSQGTRLIEEPAGIVPTEKWLRANRRRRFQAADPWNWSIGQGEVSATPLQVANVCATIAAGYWAPVRLLRDADGQADVLPAGHEAELDRDALRVLRTGMWRVVNERGGTGHPARLDREDHVLCGKTGSSQATPQPVKRRYFFQWPDGRRQHVDAYLEEDARAHFGDAQPECVGWRSVQRYPELEAGEPLPAHAWFMGYTQPAATPRGDAPRGRVYAIAVIIEYGGSGGRIAGPVAKQIAEWLLAQDE